MSDYDKKLRSMVNVLKKGDIKNRKKAGLKKKRTDTESITFRKRIDDFYDSTTKKLNSAIDEEINRLPEKETSNIYSNEIHSSRYHEYLEEVLILPHATAKFIDYATNSRGTYLDIAKLCNLFALAQPVSTDSESTPKYTNAFGRYILGLKELGIISPVSEVGLRSGDFLYWLIYDENTFSLNLQLLIDIAEKSKGSFGSFKSFIAGYWLVRNTENSQEFYYKTVLQKK